MKRADLEKGLLLVSEHYDEVVRILQTQKTRNKRKVDYREVLDDYLASRSFAQTARAFGLSPNGAYLVIYKAIRIAEELTGKSVRVVSASPAKGVH